MKTSLFEFSDTIAGYVTEFDKNKKMFGLKTTDGREFSINLTSNSYARSARNLGEHYMDATEHMYDLIFPGQYLFAYGIFYPQKGSHVFEAKAIDFAKNIRNNYRFEEPDWWIKQAASIADFFLKAQFKGGTDIDYSHYRTAIGLSGEQKGDFRQETDTISRLVYGFASTFLLTGEDKFLEAAEKGTQYLRDHMRFYDIDNNIVYWYHGIDIKGEREHKIFASEFGDDYDAIPMYEQIYALAGPMQTYRANGDPNIMKDVRMTIDLFDRFFLDNNKQGYFSHIDPITLDPLSESLGRNKGTKNWNSVGDHAPAYLINLWLATGNPKYKDFLDYTANCIVTYFPDYENSPFVNERFFEDWSQDLTWGWQQDRAVVGHNLKIAWNLMRINNLKSNERYVALAEKIAEIMPKVGMDVQRSGWYDVMERKLQKDEEFHRFAWHDRKAWWQQEQAILAYQILYGILRKPEYLKLARESAAFYNAFFLDHDDGAVYFNVLNNGIPYLMGSERMKGSHSMSGYHSIELAYLSTIYINFLHTHEPLDMYFKPMVNGFPNDILLVQPDILPKGSITITDVWVDGNPWKNFNANELTVELPNLNYRPKIKVRIVPNEDYWNK
ncbi:AGE family epimerase/isomerase [Candidatus Latescibacterota bacterium]